MKTYTLKRTQFLPISIEEAWDFFSSPRNLAAITPQYMKFRITHFSGGERMYAGQIIKYRIFILPFLPASWVTEIIRVHEPFFFVDEQRFGPYAWWHHQHSFRVVQGGVEMADEVNYALPLGWLGRFAHWAFVHRQLNGIFDYRFKILSDFFRPNSVRKTA
jgi:ligand-binding SRPBCC domain-containing protein